MVRPGEMTPTVASIEHLKRVSALLPLVVISLMVLGCNEYRSPTAPTSPTPSPSPPLATVHGFVRSAVDGRCLGGAIVELVDGPRAGERSVQTEAVCAAWNNGEALYGFLFEHFESGAGVTLRASMPGFQPASVSATAKGTNFLFGGDNQDVILSPVQ